MADIKERVVVEGDTSQAVAATKKLDKTLAATMLTAQVGAMAATKALGFLTSAVGDALDNAKANLVSTEKLSAALRQQGVEVQTGVKFLNQQSSALQTLTGVSDDVIRSMQATGLAMGATTENVDELIRASFSLANATDMDVSAAMRGLSQALNGNAASLGRYLPQVRGLTKAQLESGEAARLVNREMGQFLDINTRGLPGEVLKLKNAFDDVAEALALMVSPSGRVGILSALTDELNELATIISQGDLETKALKLGQAFTNLFPFIPGALAANVAINKLLEERIAMLNKPAPPPGTIGGGPKGGGSRGGGAVGVEGLGFSFVGGPGGTLRSEEDAARARSIGAFGAAAAPLTGDPLAAMPLSAIHGGPVMPDSVALFADAESDKAKIRRESAREQSQILQQQMQMEAAIIQGGVNTFAGFVVGAVEALATGADFSEFTKQFLKSIGTQTAAQGVQNLLQAAAIAFIPGLQGNAAALAAAGAAQIAAGTAMIGGSVAIPGGSTISAGSGGGGGGPSTAPAFAAPSGPGRDGGPRTVTVVFNGPTTKPEVGIAIREALKEAEALGV